MTATRALPPDPRTIAEMIPAREAEIARREAPKCGKDKRHGAMASRPLASQTYEVMFCGIWYECGHEGCSGNAHYLSRELAAYHGEPYVVTDGQYETWTGTQWQPITPAEFDAYWKARLGDMERWQRHQAEAARRNRRAQRAIKRPA